MDQVTVEQKQTLQLKTPIVLLALISLVFRGIKCLCDFFDYKYVNFNYIEPELVVHFPGFLTLISDFLYIAPCVLFVIYLLSCHSNYKGKALIPLTTGLIAIYPVFCLARNLLFYHVSFESISMTSWLLTDIPLFVSFGLLTMNAAKGFTKKAYLFIAVAIGLFQNLTSTYSWFIALLQYYIPNQMYLYVLTSFIAICAELSLYIALLLFGLKNGKNKKIATPAMNEPIPVVPEMVAAPVAPVMTPPVTVSVEPPVTAAPSVEPLAMTPPPVSPSMTPPPAMSADNSNPERSLRVLKECFESGLITEEEYKLKRAEIISKI